MTHEELVESLSFEERRELMIKEAADTGVRPILLQKKWKVSLGGNQGNEHLKTRIWNELTHTVLTEGADKYVLELMKLEGTAFLKHYETILQFLRPRAPQELNINVQNKIEIGFEENEEFIEGKIIEEE